MINEAGMSQMASDFVDAQTWGTPDQILETIRQKRAVVGDYELNCVFSYAGMPFDEVEASMRLFSEAVIPELARLGAEPVPATG
jgi:hypothetical protein